MKNVFENATTSTKQGDIGEARAIYEYTRMGYSVSCPLADSSNYDLIVEKNSILYRVQVKTTRSRNNAGGWVANLRTFGGNRSGTNIKHRKKGDWDLLFVLTQDDRIWSIPEESLGKVTHSVNIGNLKYSEFEI